MKIRFSWWIGNEVLWEKGALLAWHSTQFDLLYKISNNNNGLKNMSDLSTLRAFIFFKLIL